MKTSEIREKFLKYFEEKGHTIVSSSPLVPGNDPTLLFTNAGMVQFKELFLGDEQRIYTRATSSQRCVRAGGKHNDLENVGFTARHHTFFEMLGNFSFGDYFKKEAIAYAYEFITQVLKLPKDKLWITVYKDDQEAEDIWLKDIGVDKNKFSRCGDKDNFWAMGDTGPCGPCSEIFYDHGSDIPGGPPGSPDEDGDRYIEIWNLVFMQYNRDKEGNLTPLPQPSVDTGMGLERIAAILQGKHNNYDIDIFTNIIDSIASKIGCNDKSHKSLRVIADHLRSCSFLVIDGVNPSNDGRGYVLRRIMRRAIRHGHKLGAKFFFSEIVEALVANMKDAYPELAINQEYIEKVFKKEEEQFSKTLNQGMKVLESSLKKLKGKTIPGNIAFKLYDTYGFPLDLTEDIARERGFNLDLDGFKECMQQQIDLARSASNFSVSDNLATTAVTTFTGYNEVESSSKIQQIFVNEKECNSVTDSDAIIVLTETPFYAESGGQVGDTGKIISKSGTFLVLDTKKQKDTFLHFGKIIDGNLTVNDSVNAIIDNERRDMIRANHSATHLLHAALRTVLGSHVQQKGSIVDAKRLRFDFSHGEPLSVAEINALENIVNSKIRQNSEVITKLMNKDEAVKMGAMALFGEKYTEKVRVLTMGGDYSIELCGGTHVGYTGEIGMLKIVAESSTAAGVRRIEAVTGFEALHYFQEQSALIANLTYGLKVPESGLQDRIIELQNSIRTKDKEISKLQSMLAKGQRESASIERVNNINVVVQKLPAGDVKTMREMVDNLKNKHKPAIVVLCLPEGEKKISIICGVSKDITSMINAKDVVNHVAEQVGGRGGGRPDMAQAGGTDLAKLDEALSSVVPWLKEKI